MSQSQWQVGSTYRNFQVQHSVPLPELHMHLLELVHQPTGARVMHLINDDTENVFCLAFSTRPASSNGVAHILEHTVLCGSAKYPVRDPFFAMIRRSLNTFMNAMTGADCTFYPAASQVPSDFYNLLSIYIDAVFHPLLSPESFLQEGHRLEYSTMDDSTTPLEYKGIVYNEMKGAMAAPMSRLFNHVNALLYPDTTYGVNSGGTPAEILNLSHAELCEFHKTYYHPSRCIFYFYGNLPTAEHLDFISSQLLDKTTAVTPLPPIPTQKRYDAPVSTQSFSYPAEENDTPAKNTMFALAWLTCPIAEQEKLLALTILCVILMDTDASPLKRAILDSQLCKQASLYLDTDNSDVPLYLICKGCDEANTKALEQLILDSLVKIAQEGISHDAIESALHQMELHRSEITGNGSPYGLTLFTRAGLPRLHGVAPENTLLIHTLFQAIRERLKQQPRYLEELIDQYFINNTHRVTVVMKPDTQLAAKESSEEQTSLQKRSASLTEEERQNIISQAQKLAALQEAQDEQDTNVLPIVKLEDIPRQSRDYPINISTHDNLKVFHYSCFTNQIIYLDYTLPLCDIAEADLPYVRLLSNLYGQMGCGGESFSSTLEYIQAHTGGVGASTVLYRHTQDVDKITPQFSISGKALHRKIDKLGPLLTSMAQGIDLHDKPRLQELLLKQWSHLQSNFTQRAMHYASNLAASGQGTAGRISYAWQGLEYYYMIKQLAENIETSLDPLVLKLAELQERIFHGNDAHLVITCDDEAFAMLKNAGYYGLASLPVRPYTPWQAANYTVPSVPCQGRLISSPVASICQLVRTIPYAHPDAAALRIASVLMENITLHRIIREQGGAYGSGASCNLMAGYFSFYSYRDPNLNSTLRAFTTAVNGIAEGNFNDEELFESKLELFQGLDTPVAPGSRGEVAYTLFREEKPLEMRQAFRDRIFATSKDDIIAAVKRHLLPQLDNSTTVAFANEELFARENSSLTKPLTLLQV
jgi:Zn-dependent M16 (insulinase) family peptidase